MRATPQNYLTFRKQGSDSGYRHFGNDLNTIYSPGAGAIRLAALNGSGQGTGPRPKHSKPLDSGDQFRNELVFSLECFQDCL